MADLIATVGAADANSYVTVDEATAYHETRPGSTWEDVDDQEAALIMATRLMDGLLVWTGSAATALQALGWPRNGMLTRNNFAIAADVLPRELKDATSELAMQLVAGDLLADDDVVRKRITSIRAGSVALTFDVKKKDQDYIGLFPDVSNMAKLPDTVLALLVPSWYLRPEQFDTPFFEVFP